MVGYLDPDRMPLPFCPGCGHHRLLEALDQALQRKGWDPRSIVLVTDIGCIGLSDGYFALNALHGLHGRSVTYATGIKLARPDLHVVVLIGDGGCGIGGNHLIHAARRNIGVTVVVANNFNFGMTGGEHSALTPEGAFTVTTRGGNLERPLDLCATVAVNGAVLVARSSVFSPDLVDVLEAALGCDGFALVDVWSLCTAHFAPRNALTRRVLLERLAQAGEGVLHQEDRAEYAKSVRVGDKRGEGKGLWRTVAPRFAAQLEGRCRVLVAGAAGGRVQTAARLFAMGAVLSDLYASQRSEYPVTVMSGYSLGEIMLDRVPVGYMGIEFPDVAVVVAAEGWRKVKRRLQGMRRDGRVYVDEDLLPLEAGDAQVIPLRFSSLASRATRRNKALLAISAVLRMEAWYPAEALIAAAELEDRPEIAVWVREVVEAGASLV